MAILDTNHKRKSAVITSIILAVLILLMFNYGMKYFDPPVEYGVAVNFGNSDVGSGEPVEDVLEASKSEDAVEEEIEEDVQEEQQVEGEMSEDVSEDESDSFEEGVVADEVAKDVPTVKKVEDKKKVEPKKDIEKTDSKPKTTNKPKTESKKVKPKKTVSDGTKNLLNGLLGNSKTGSTKGEGDDNQVGVKGKSTGDSKSSKYYGNGGKGSGGNYQLAGRNALSKPKQKPDCEKEGKVVVSIVVNRSGKVISARPGASGTTATDKCLWDAAKKAALKTKWNADGNAPSSQRGKIIYKFSLGQ